MTCNWVINKGAGVFVIKNKITNHIYCVIIKDENTNNYIVFSRITPNNYAPTFNCLSDAITYVREMFKLR